jgi:hypothetical protein
MSESVEQDAWVVEYHYGNGTNDIVSTTHKTRAAAIKYASEFVTEPNTKYQLGDNTEEAAEELYKFGFFGDESDVERAFTYALIYHIEESHFRSRLTK